MCIVQGKVNRVVVKVLGEWAGGGGGVTCPE